MVGYYERKNVIALLKDYKMVEHFKELCKIQGAYGHTNTNRANFPPHHCNDCCEGDSD